MSQIQKLFALLDKSSKRQLIWLVFFTLFVSLVETIGISAIFPFIDIASNFDKIYSNKYYQWIFNSLGFEEEVDFVIIFGLVLVGFYLFRGGINLLSSYVISSYKLLIYAQISKRLHSAYLQMPFQIFTKKNSSYLTKSVITEALNAALVFESMLILISEIFVITFIYILILIVSWKITISLTIVLFIEILFINKLILKKIQELGIKRANIHAKLYGILNNLFGNFKQIKLQDKRILNAETNEFAFNVDEYSRINISSIFLRAIPRTFLESSGFILLTIFMVIFIYINQTNVTNILPIVSLYVLALIRLLPSVNRIVSSYNNFIFHQKSIDIVLEHIQTPQENLIDEKVKFDHEINLSDVTFSFEDRIVLKGVSLNITKGEKIAFIGDSGSGKSTLVDLIIGLYRPIEGEIRIDKILLDNANLQNWRSQVGYIPQQIYLFDGTVAENVYFGRDINSSLLNKVLKQANIFDFLESKHGVNTIVGEGGVQLSGGQKQRIAIARALYGKPEILILDEATSALDEKTESKIMNEIYEISKNKTLIIVAHRLSSLFNCDKVFEVKDCSIKKL